MPTPSVWMAAPDRQETPKQGHRAQWVLAQAAAVELVSVQARALAPRVVAGKAPR